VYVIAEKRSPYQQFVDELTDEQVLHLLRGETGMACDERRYCLSDEGVKCESVEADQGEGRTLLRQRESALLAQLYRSQPLCRAEFEYQAVYLLEEHGAERFCRHPDNPDHWALMIDEARLVAVGPGDVRSRYGYFCECEDVLSAVEAAARVSAWLASGEAYEDYRTKTTCRYC
jgi:hypothetical protein